MNKRVRKIAVLTALSSMLLTGCNNAKTGVKQEKTEEYTQYIGTETEKEQIESVSNQTIAKIYKEYKEKTGKDIDIKDLEIIEFDDPNYVWNKGDKYIYDYRVNDYNNEEYTYIEPGYYSKIYAVIDDYTPICALYKNDDGIFNIEVTYAVDKDHVYEPSENYIYIDEPSIDNFNELKDADEYINADEEKREPLIEKEQKKVFILK